jgi:hypothetical protein
LTVDWSKKEEATMNKEEFTVNSLPEKQGRMVERRKNEEARGKCTGVKGLR